MPVSYLSTCRVRSMSCSVSGVSSWVESLSHALQKTTILRAPKRDIHPNGRAAGLRNNPTRLPR